jgi:hypothetical protein
MIHTLAAQLREIRHDNDVNVLALHASQHPVDAA